MSDILAGAAPKWQARDDVYQVGQLLGMLIKGDAQHAHPHEDVRRLACSDHLKEIVYRCIGERRKRYESADELIDALSNAAGALERRGAAVAQGRARRVHRHPDAPRRDAVRAARRAGAIVHGGPSDEDDRRRPRPAQRAAGRRAGRAG